jgi:hypothetical protein
MPRGAQATAAMTCGRAVLLALRSARRRSPRTRANRARGQARSFDAAAADSPGSARRRLRDRSSTRQDSGEAAVVGRPPRLASAGRHQMNLQLHHVISDITRQTGLAFVDAILAGEWDPWVLASYATSGSRPPKKSSPNRWWATIELSTCSLCDSPRQPIADIRSSIDDCDHEIRRSLERPERRGSQNQPNRPSAENV